VGSGSPTPIPAPLPLPGEQAANSLPAVHAPSTAKTYKRRRSRFLPIAVTVVCALGAFAGLAVLIVLLNRPLEPTPVAKNPPKKNPPQVSKSESSRAGVAAPSRTTAASARETNTIARDASTEITPAAGDFNFTPNESKTTEPPAPASSAAVAPTTNVPAETTPAPVKESPDEALSKLVKELFDGKKLLLKKEYPTLRKAFADHFAAMHADEIRQGLVGDDYDAMMFWFEEHPDIQEEFYTAIRPGADNIPRAVGLFNELRKRYPKQIVPYASLAIATAVVWDDEQKGIYEYAHDARATRSKMPEETAGVFDNFQFLVETENVMQGRIQFVPWEFLVYIVNHRTPLGERQWALANYLNKRAMFGKCYSDVPYDYDMLNTHSEVTRLSGKDYNFPNIRQFGGVCMIQADYAARVGKSLGVAAASVNGESAFGGSHAWVMWAELKQATASGIVFSLESHGRYRDDHYYVGHLQDPQTGERITDRDMELRLQTVGLDTIAKRHTDLVMRAYPWLVKDASLDAEGQLNLLSQVIGYCPGNEEAWLAAARLARESAGDKTLSKPFGQVLDKLFVTFARVPDFTWKVFDDLAAYPDDAKQRRALYERLIALYETAKRPDLAAQARLKLTDYLVEENKKADAIDGLAIAIRKFPAEGHIVPKLLDRLEQLAADVPDADARLVQFYSAFLPQIPQKRNNRPSEYCIQMYERAIALFMRTGQPQLVQALLQELAKIKAPKG
jgi:hypothetical protein